MTRFLISLLAVAAMAAGCSKNDGGDPAPEPAGGKPIAVCGKALTVSSKAPFEGTIGGANTLTALVLGSQTDGNYTTAYCKGILHHPGGSQLHAGPGVRRGQQILH